MKKIIMLLIVLGITLTPQLLTAQPNRRNRPERTDEKLTAYQVKVVKAILVKYDKKSLTADDAKAIFKEIREEGINLGPQVDKVIEDAGFDTKKLRELAPPPERNKENMGNKENIQGKGQNTRQKATPIEIAKPKINVFRMSSSAVNEDNFLDSEFTGDGQGISMPLEWTNIPKGTKYFALNLWHLPNPSDKSEVKSYWVVYDIPVNITSLPKNVQNIGVQGYNDKDTNGYDPMKSKGPGPKLYNVTLYALSEKPVFSTEKVYREDLLKAIKDITIEECTLQYLYERTQKKVDYIKSSRTLKREEDE